MEAMTIKPSAVLVFSAIILFSACVPTKTAYRPARGDRGAAEALRDRGRSHYANAWRPGIGGFPFGIFGHGYGDRAIEDLRASLQANPNDPLAWEYLGDAEYGKRAVRAYSRAMSLGRRTIPLLVKRSLEESDSLPALADLDEAISIDSGIPDLFLERGRRFERVGDSDRALADYSHAIELDSQFMSAFSERVDVRRRMKDFDGALEDLNSLGELSVIQDGETAMTRRRRDSIFRDFRPGQLRDHSDWEQAWRRARILSEAGRHREAAAIYTHLIDAESEARGRTHFLIQRGQEWLAVGERDSAVADFNEVLLIDSGMLRFLLHRTQALGLAWNPPIAGPIAEPTLPTTRKSVDGSGSSRDRPGSPTAGWRPRR